MKELHITDTAFFVLKGQFLGFTWDGSKIKYLRMAVAEDELTIKLSKEARASCKIALKPNSSIQVTGESKVDPKTKDIQLKAYQICPQNESRLEELEYLEESLAQENKIAVAPTAKKIKLLICQKSGCQKKGGKQRQQAIEAILRDRGLDQSVIFKESGCLGKCSLAPNIVLMPSKKRLSSMKPEEIVDLLLKL